VSASPRAPMGEFDLIAKWFTKPARRSPLGVGDDCALLAPRAGQQLAVSTDLLVEGRHFLSTVPADLLGHKSLAVNLSDLAACGAEPLAFTLSLAMPRVDSEFLEGFSSGLWTLADRFHVDLVGGDTTAGPLTIGITVFGEVPKGAALLRGGAQVGDDLWVSGTLGDARLALEAFRGRVSLSEAGFAQARRAMEQPQPRVELGLALRGLAHSAIDLSDGLLGDLGHVLARSRVGAVVDEALLPRSALLASQSSLMQRQCLLTGGDDYELLFSAAPQDAQRVLQAGQSCLTTVTRIGRVVADAGLIVRDAAGQALDLHGQRAFDHFAS
jgi:thiamine-monophosphate kinase